jgi:Alpha-tubulin suppressor and related RCC1 domain-containing proteins
MLAVTSCGGGDQTSPPAQVASVSVSPAEVTLGVGESHQLTATARDAAGNSLTSRTFDWTTSAPSLATVSDGGLVHGIAPGDLTVTATTEGESGSAAIVVAAAVAAVTVSPEEASLLVGESQQLTATPRDEDGNPLEGRAIAWTTDASQVATVSPTGLVAAVGPGSATITATVEGKSAAAIISVSVPPIATVTISPSELPLLAGVTQQLTATARDEAGNPLTGRVIAWSSSQPSVASVSSSGQVTGIVQGTVTITATAEEKHGTATVSVLASASFASFAAGGAHTCALTTDGTAFCWGRGENGQLGIPVPTTTCTIDGAPFPCSMAPVAVSGGLAFARLAAGGTHTCGLTEDGTAYCWGRNNSGQLGDNSTQGRDTPVPVATALKFETIDAGAEHTCGLTDGGAAYCWGRNSRGQLGDGTTTSHSTPVAVTGGQTFQQIVAGGFDPLSGSEGEAQGDTCGLTTDGNAYCWGDNERGQLGTGAADLNTHPEPAPVEGDLIFTSLTAGLGRHVCGLTGAGAAYCWGENSFGALGDGTNVDRPAPVPVSGGLSFVQVIAAGFIGHTCGRVGSGAAYCWGDNEVGQIGDHSTTDRLEPAAVFGGRSYSILDAGFRHTCGLTAGTLYCWGSNGAGQLGNNTNTAQDSPARVFGQP